MDISERVETRGGGMRRIDHARWQVGLPRLLWREEVAFFCDEGWVSEEMSQQDRVKIYMMSRGGRMGETGLRNTAYSPVYV